MTNPKAELPLFFHGPPVCERCGRRELQSELDAWIALEQYRKGQLVWDEDLATGSPWKPPLGAFCSLECLAEWSRELVAEFA